MFNPVIPNNPLIRTIHNDEVFWQEKSITNLQQVDQINVQRDKWLTTKPSETLSHITAVGQILTKNDPVLQREAIQFLRTLKDQLKLTEGGMLALTTQPKHPDALYPALTNIHNSIIEIDRLLVELGRVVHAREHPTKSTQTAAKTHQAAAASTVLAGTERVIPASPTRHYTSIVTSTTDTAVPFMRELLLGIGNNTDEYLIEGSSSFVAVPTIFGVDVMRGTYLLNGKPVHDENESIDSAIEAYRKYCKFVGGTNEGYALASLLGQSHLAPLTEKAQDLFSERGLFANGKYFTFDVDNDKQIVILSVKAVMEGRNPIETKDAILVKREIRFPLQELREAAEFLDNLNEMKSLIAITAGKDQGKKIAELKNLLSKTVVLLPSATAEDTISSPIATSEFAHTFLSTF